MSIYAFQASLRSSERVGMNVFKGRVLLVVNTASKCAFTPQFKGLEWLNRQYFHKGFCVVGFPCNQFAKQDPDNNRSIKSFCLKNYGVSFPMFSKIEVNDSNIPLYIDFLKMRLEAFCARNALSGISLNFSLIAMPMWLSATRQ